MDYTTISLQITNNKPKSLSRDLIVEDMIKKVHSYSKYHYLKDDEILVVISSNLVDRGEAWGWRIKKKGLAVGDKIYLKDGRIETVEYILPKK